MVLALAVPDQYPWVMLSATAVPFVTSFIMGGKVMSARKKFNVPLPNLYAVPGVHDKADDFNRVQRGHQNMFETMSSVISMVLVAGLKHPLVASSCAVAYCVGNYFYLSGYADSSKDVAGARYTNPLAALKPLGMLGSFFTCVYACYGMLK